MESAKIRINQYIDQNIQQWAEWEVLAPTQQLAYNEGVSENGVSNMKIEKTGFMSVDMTWEWLGPENVPLHKYLNDGTPPHDINALGKLYGGADYLRWYDKNRKPIFRKHVKHPGIKPGHWMERGWDIGKPRLKDRISNEVNKWVEINSGRR